MVYGRPMHIVLEIAGPEIFMVLALLMLKASGNGWIVDRLVSTCRIARTDSRIPTIGRYMLTLAIIPIPGPFDEIMATCAALVLLTRSTSRVAIAEAWHTASSL